MSDLANINVKVDRAIKTEADVIANAMGMTLSTAINVFLHQMVSEKAIPFKIQVNDADITSFGMLIDSIRDENRVKGFLTDEEINAEIQLYRKEAQRSAP